MKEHNHTIALAEHVLFLRSHRNISDEDISAAQMMESTGIKTSQIMKLFVKQSGGYGSCGFTVKDLYNRLDLERKTEIIYRDAKSAIRYLSAKQDSGPRYFFKYDVESEMKLRRLLWCDSQSCQDYEYLGDALILTLGIDQTSIGNHLLY